MPTNQPSDVCARCCKALAPTQARWNQRYWGMAHRRCQAPAVWPPKFRPPMDPNEVMRQISALVSHLAQLTATSGLPLPQPDLPPQLANKTQSSQSQRMDWRKTNTLNWLLPLTQLTNEKNQQPTHKHQNYPHHHHHGSVRAPHNLPRPQPPTPRSPR